jgi:hypothetical protein
MTRLSFLGCVAILFGLVAITPASAGYDACVRLSTGEISLGDIGKAKDFLANHDECIGVLPQLAVPGDPVSIITYFLIAADATGAFGDPGADAGTLYDACIALIPDETLELLKKLGISLPDSIQNAIDSHDPNALNDALNYIKQNIPEVAAALGQMSCACAVATSGLGDKIVKIVNDVISCGEAFADSVKAVWGALKSIAECGEYIITVGLAGSCGGDDGPPPPTIIDCTRQGLPYDMYYDGTQYTSALEDKGGGSYYSPDYNQACVCPAPMVMVSHGETDPRYMTCECPVEGEVAAIPGVCKCPDGQSLIALDGNKNAPAFCGTCPAGATSQDGYCTSCPAGKVPWYAFQTSAYPADYAPTPDNFCFACGARSRPDANGQSCVPCAVDEYVDGNFSCSKCAAQNGEYLNASGTACISNSSCAAGMTVRPAGIGDAGYNANVAGFACGCPSNSVLYKGACVTELTCNGDFQVADYDNNRCVDSCPRGTVRRNHGGKENPVWTCDSCSADSYAANNTCNTCPAGTRSDGNNNCVPECGIAGYAYDGAKNACEFCGPGKQVISSNFGGSGYSITQSYCADCPSGTMSDNSGSCVACGGGNAVVIGNSCTICKPWQKVHLGAGLFDENRCEDICQGGVYVDDGDRCYFDPVSRKQICAPVCASCGENSYVENNACHSCGTKGIADDYSNTCQLCEAGTVAKNVGGRISCVASCMEVGNDVATRASYVTDPERPLQCVKCPEGSNPNPEHSACSVCSPGYVWAPALMQCVSLTRPPLVASVPAIRSAGLHVPGPPPATTETLLIPGETLPPPACASGLQWDGRTCLAAPVPPPACAPGTSWDGRACVARPALPRCPAGTHWNNRSCAPNLAGAQACPANSRLVGTRCIPNDRAAVCPPGSTWNGQSCSPAARPACPPNTAWDGSRCVAGQSASRCAAGSRWDGIRCVTASPAPPVCPPQTRWDGAGCVALQAARPSCPSGTGWDGRNCVAVAAAPPPARCPSNMRFNGVRCVPGGTLPTPPRAFAGMRAPGIPVVAMRPRAGPYLRPGGFTVR